jgi:hypothetical protein
MSTKLLNHLFDFSVSQRSHRVNAYIEDRPHAEDGEMHASEVSIERIGQEQDEHSDAHLRGSGFGVLNIEYDEDYEDSYSPSELGIEGTNFIRPTLTDRMLWRT